MSSLIETGWIKRNKGSPSEEHVGYEMRFVDEMGLKEVVNLQETVAMNLPDPEIFRSHPVEEFGALFRIERSVIGIFTEEGLIAYSIIHLPGEGEENLGKDIAIPAEEQKSLAHLQATVVHPIYRGNSLQRRMAGAHVKVIKDLGSEHVCCTISPKNPASLRSILSCGFVVRGLKIKFGWMLRYIMYKNVLRPLIISPEEVWMRSSEIQGQIDLLNRGFLGFKMAKLPEGYEICYGRCLGISKNRKG
jgi:L-amino acid N-acyltransferase YncA